MLRLLVFTVVVTSIFDDGNHPRLQLFSIAHRVERRKDNDKSIVQQVFCHIVIPCVLPAYLQQMGLILRIEKVECLTVTLFTPL